jgi:hypothetical protein
MRSVIGFAFRLVSNEFADRWSNSNLVCGYHFRFRSQIRYQLLVSFLGGPYTFTKFSFHLSLDM